MNVDLSAFELGAELTFFEWNTANGDDTNE